MMATTGAPKDAPTETVACPVCGVHMALTAINQHLDSNCTVEKTEETKRKGESPPKAAQSARSEVKLQQPVHGFFNLKRPQPGPPKAEKKPPEDEPPTLKRQRTEEATPQPHHTPAPKSDDPVRMRSKQQPLADLVRPRSLDDYVGQSHIIGSDSILRRLVEADRIPSLVLWGGPGCGKTTLAKIIAKKSKCHIAELSAVTSGVNDIRKVVQEAQGRKSLMGQGTIVFVDEIHRFNKAQQDALLPHVERGEVTLIGATTENPSFSCNAALLSRCRVFVLEKLKPEEVVVILKRALTLVGSHVEVDDDTLHYLAVMCDGDGRNALNALDAVVGAQPLDTIKVTRHMVEEALQKTHLLYDKAGEEHYNIISALHKSMRGSDPQAALYWLGRMLEAGEDPRYIARRMIRFASEDVGLADPQALVQAVSALQASQLIGMPECSVCLAQCAVYLALAPKSNALDVAYTRVKECIQKNPAYPVPLHIRNAPTRLMNDLGYGKGYKYNPDYTPEECKDQTYLPDQLIGTKFYPDA